MIRKALLTCSLLGLYTLALAQNYKEDSYKSWSDGPLTQEDFTSRHLASTLQDVAGELKWTITFKPVTDKIGNLRYSHFSTETRMDKLRSWMDPDHFLPWSLDYFQSEFDMVETYRRKLQAEMNSNPLDVKDIQDYYDRMLTSAGEALQQETNLGRDATAVARYSVKYKEELAALPEDDQVSEPEFCKSLLGEHIYFGYLCEIYGAPVSSGVGPAHGLNMGLAYPIRNVYLGLDMSMGRPGALKQDGFYHDDKIDYDWRKGVKCNAGQINLLIGYNIWDRPRIALRPIGGIGVSFLDQHSDIKNGNNSFVNSETSGLRLQAGMEIAWKLWRTLGITTAGGGYSETCLVFKAYGAHTQFDGLGETWSLNLGVAWDWGAWLLKHSKTVTL